MTILVVDFVEGNPPEVVLPEGGILQEVAHPEGGILQEVAHPEGGNPLHKDY